MLLLLLKSQRYKGYGTKSIEDGNFRGGVSAASGDYEFLVLSPVRTV